LEEDGRIGEEGKGSEYRCQQVSYGQGIVKRYQHFPLGSFSIRRLQNLTANPLEILPCINQVELNYWNPQPDLVKVRWAVVVIPGGISDIFSSI
jgi:hypothetical protein